MNGTALVVHIPKIALRVSDVAVALGLGTQEVRYLLEVGLLPPPRVILRERFWLCSDIEEALARVGARDRLKAKPSTKTWKAKT